MGYAENKLKRFLLALWEWLKSPYLWIEWCQECGKRFISIHKDSGFCSDDCAGHFYCNDDIYQYEAEPWDLERDFYDDDAYLIYGHPDG